MQQVVLAAGQGLVGVRGGEQVQHALVAHQGAAAEQLVQGGLDGQLDSLQHRQPGAGVGGRRGAGAGLGCEGVVVDYEADVHY